MEAPHPSVKMYNVEDYQKMSKDKFKEKLCILVENDKYVGMLFGIQYHNDEFDTEIERIRQILVDDKIYFRAMILNINTKHIETGFNGVKSYDKLHATISIVYDDDTFTINRLEFRVDENLINVNCYDLYNDVYNDNDVEYMFNKAFSNYIKGNSQLDDIDIELFQIPTNYKYSFVLMKNELVKMGFILLENLMPTISRKNKHNKIECLRKRLEVYTKLDTDDTVIFMVTIYFNK